MGAGSLPSWERGLKSVWGSLRSILPRVAPLVGAWIEIIGLYSAVNPCHRSLPSWERGLKLWGVDFDLDQLKSLPSWERGLKSALHPLTLLVATVAPLVGAWIEIFINVNCIWKPESLPSWERGLKFWPIWQSRIPSESLPSWERGLKSAG